jgi:hypothetical protein
MTRQLYLGSNAYQQPLHSPVTISQQSHDPSYNISVCFIINLTIAASKQVIHTVGFVHPAGQIETSQYDPERETCQRAG